jgi:membrane protein required for colicin V production
VPPFNWLDWVLIVILAWCAFRSFRRGFSREIIGLAAALLALLCGMWFYGTAATLFVRWTGEGRVANLAGFIAVVVVVLIAGAIVGWIVNRFVKLVGLSFFDRLLGALFGIVRGVLIASALLSAFIAFGPSTRDSIAPGAVVHSQIAPVIVEVSRFFVAAAPMELKQAFRREYEKFSRASKGQRTGDGG